MSRTYRFKHLVLAIALLAALVGGTTQQKAHATSYSQPSCGTCGRPIYYLQYFDHSRRVWSQVLVYTDRNEFARNYNWLRCHGYANRWEVKY